MVYQGNSFFDTLFKNRLLQHVLFWIAVTLYLLGGLKSRFETYSEALTHTLPYLPGHMILVYGCLYFLIPQFILNRKFILFFFSLIPLVFISALYMRIIDTQLYHHGGKFEGLYDERIFIHAIFANFNICGIAVAIKLFKYWYLEKEAKQQAEQANLTSQLALLKSQVHPHFLFNTLNNLYSLTLESSKEAPAVVLKLSALLRYMLYECDTNEISLEKEIEIINNYIKLEQIRYGNRLEVSLSYTGDIKDKKIAPLLLLPFLENSFKHGTSEQIEQCWISLDLNVANNIMNMILINSRHHTDNLNVGGIGLENVKKRLDLLYKDAYLLKIIPEEETFTVSLSVQLNN